MKGPCQCFRRNNLSGKGKPVQYYSSAVRARSILHQEVVRHIENIVQEDSAHAGSSELVTMIEDYGMNFMGTDLKLSGMCSIRSSRVSFVHCSSSSVSKCSVNIRGPST